MQGYRDRRGLAYGLIESLESRRLLSAGGLDISFSGDGRATASFDPTGVRGNGMAVQSDGKIVEVGAASDGRFALVRYNADGTLDTSFGPTGSGKLTTHVGDADAVDIAYAVAIQSDGKIVVVGEEGDTNEGDDQMFVTRFASNGTFDHSFSGDGLVELGGFDSITNLEASAKAVAIQKDGKIVVAGDEQQGFPINNDNLVIARLNTNGSLDTSFSGNGKARIDLGDNEDAEAIAIDYNDTPSTNPDYGKIVVAGHQTADTDSDITDFGLDQTDTYKVVIARFNTDGTPDTSLNKIGAILTVGDPAASSADAKAVAIESGGAIVIAGSVGTNIGSKDHDFFMERFSVTGAFDKTFGTNGITTTTFGGNDQATSMVIGGFGQQLIVGGTSSGRIALSAYSINGVIDGNFGTSGKVVTQFTNNASNVALALAPNHTIVAAGGTNFDTARYFDIGPEVSVSSLDSTAGEPGFRKVGHLLLPVPNPASLIVARDENLPIATRIFFTIGGTATPPGIASDRLHRNDYTLSGMSIVVSPISLQTTGGYVDIPAGQTFTIVTLTPVDDTIPEPTETAIFSIQPNLDYVPSFPKSQTISILDNDSPSTTATTTLNANADAYVQDGADAGTNFGSSTELEVKKSGSGFNRVSYIKFDLSNVSAITSAQLQLFGSLSDTQDASIATSVFSVADTSWTESGINFNNAPALGSTALATTTITGTTTGMYTFDVTSYLQAQKAAGHNIVSFALTNPATSSSFVKFNSKEAGSQTPALMIVSPASSTVGTFNVSSEHKSVSVGQSTTIAVTWQVPAGSWRQLQDIELQLSDDNGLSTLIDWDQADNTLALFNPATGKFGLAKPLGTEHVPSNQLIDVLLKNSSMKASGPTSPVVTVTFELRFKQAAAGHHFTIEAAASNDKGAQTNLGLGGSVAVT